MRGAFPLIHDEDEAVPGPETMVDPARRTGHIGVLGELAGPVGQCLAERGGVALELPDDKHAHFINPPPVSCTYVRGTSPGAAPDQSGTGARRPGHQVSQP